MLKSNNWVTGRLAPRRSPSQFSRLLAFALLSNTLGISIASAQASEPARWSKLTEPVFRLVAYSEGQLFAAHQGLPFTEIPTALAEDSEGFLWVGTQNGLERWDGYGFHTYPSTGAKSGELRDSFVQALHIDPKGRLWVGTYAGGLARYDGEQDLFVNLPVGSAGLSGEGVTSIEDDGAGGLWVGTSGGLDRVEADGSHIDHYKHRDGEVGGLPDNLVRALLRDHSGALWVATGKGLVRRDPKGSAFVPIQLPATSAPEPPVRTLFQSSDGRVWIGTRHDGAYVIAPNSLTAQPLAGTRDDPNGIRRAEILSATETQSGEIWLGTDGQGVIAVDPASLATHLIARNPAVPTSLPNDTVWALHRDRSGLTWVATSDGISYQKPQHAIETVFEQSNFRGVTSGDSAAIFAMHDGRIAIAAGHNGVSIIDPDSSQVTGLRPDEKRPSKSLPRDAVTALAATEKGDLFIGTRRGLFLADRSLRSVSPIMIAGEDPAAIIFSLWYEPHRLWVGNLDGLFELAPAEGKAATKDQWSLVDRIDVRGVSVIAPASASALWIGTINGLFRFDPGAHSLKLQPLVSGKQQAARAHFITSLLADRDGRLWVGTNGEGIFVLDQPKSGDGSLVPALHITDGLPNMGVDTLLADRNGGVWVSTDNGVAQIDPHTGAVQPVDRGDGLAITDYWLDTGLTTSHGELLFGGQGGFTIIRPDLVRRSDYDPPIVITSITVGNQFIPSSAYNGAGRKRALRVPSNADAFSVEFSALDYSAPENNRYAYKLDGYDRQWIHANADRRMAAYTNLPPGQYLLRVKGSNHTGTWASAELTLPIAIAAAWYQSTWFHLAEAAGAIVLLAAIVQGRTMVLRHRQRELMQLVAQRTEELAHANDERRALIENVAHDLRTPLTSLRGYLETTIIKEASLSASDRQKYLAIALRQSENLMRLVRELFDLVRLEEVGVKISREPFQLSDLVEDIVQKFRIVAENRNIVVQAHCAASLPLMVGDIVLVERLIDNILENAIRHTPEGGRISLDAATVNQWIQLDISDTGRGISDTDISSIFDRFRRGGTGSVSEPAGAGLGLAIVKRIVELHGGHIAVQSKVDIGTCFSVRFPIVAADPGSNAPGEAEAVPLPQ